MYQITLPDVENFDFHLNCEEIVVLDWLRQNRLNFTLLSDQQDLF